MLTPQSKWYCRVYIHYVKNVDKVKMDYSLYKLKFKEEGILQSENSNETFKLNEFSKCKFGLYQKIKRKDGVHFGFIIDGKNDFSYMEKIILNEIKPFVSKRLFFKPRFKKFFLNRVNQILFESE